ncbi:MAG: YceI family protein [Acidimicrobiales bacterium]|nr:YceI family protein [Acidimicrobiales bacterium]
MDNSKQGSGARSSGRKGKLVAVIGGIVALVVVAAVVIVQFVLPDDAPDKEKLTDATNATGAEIDPTSLDGTWAVVAGSGDEATYAGYRVEEVFAAGARKATAIGRTGDVIGELTVDGGKVTQGKVTVDMTTLTSDEGRRDNAIRDRGIQTNKFPEATFEITSPVALPSLHDGKVSQVKVTGDLTLHGAKKSIEVDLSVRPSGDVVTIDSSVPIAFADYGIEAPSIGGFVSVEDKGSLEFRISFRKQ